MTTYLVYRFKVWRETSRNAGEDSGLRCPMCAAKQENVRTSMIKAMDPGPRRVKSLAAFV
jgi:hypothetical protein